MSQNSLLLVKTKICSRDNYELLDYDSTKLIVNRININHSGILFRSNKNTFFVENFEKCKENKNDLLLKIIKDTQNDCYFVKNEEYSNNLDKLLEQDPAYIVYKNSFLEEERNKKDKVWYKLSEGDIIKLGRVYIKILCINLGSKKSEEKIKNNINNNSTQKYFKDINFTSLRKNSSYSSFYLNGQEIIKGSCNGLNYNSENEEENDDEIFILNNKNLKIKRPLKNKIVFPRIDSPNNLLTSRIPIKLKITHKKSLNLFAQKNKNIKNDLQINKKICRICYGEEEKSDIENPLISPCICKGSMKYIHYKCLKNWLDSKIESSPFSSIELKDNIGMCYCTDNFICELCKTKFPDYININGKLFNLSFYKTSFKKFLIFESLQIENSDKKFIHILSFDQTNKIIIGRANECDISFPEISVSRHHCFIHYDEKKECLYLEDNSSRFGSLILIQNPLLLMIDKLPLNIQKSKTYIKIKLVVPFSLFSCCSINNNSIKKYNSYQEQIELYLDIFKTLVIKNNNTNNDSDEIDEDDKYEEDKIYKNNYKRNNSIKLVSCNKLKKDNLFLLRLKNLDYKNRFNNMKKYKKKIKIKEISLNKNNTSKNLNSNDIDTQRLLNTHRISINSLGGNNGISINRLNINHNLYVGNLNLFSLNANLNPKNNNDKEEEK